MTVKELLNVSQCRVIALNGGDGKKLFDTRNNQKDFVQKYHNGVILSVWADIEVIRNGGFTPHIQTVIKCYVSNGSWMR